jgi:hypothetical protein
MTWSPNAAQLDVEEQAVAMPCAPIAVNESALGRFPKSVSVPGFVTLNETKIF